MPGTPATPQAPDHVTPYDRFAWSDATVGEWLASGAHRELKRLIEENSDSPMIVPGTDMDGKRRASAAPSKPAKDIDASEMERAEGE